MKPHRLPTSLMVLAALLTLLTGACNDDDGSDLSPLAEPAGPCEGVWVAAFNACWEECSHTCVGLGCLFCPCSFEADRALAFCCAGLGLTGSDADLCLENTN